MSIPKEILAIKRPSNTIVKATTKHNVYSVVLRTSKRIPGKKYPRPVELGVVGRIVDGTYHEVKNNKKSYEIDVKTYGSFALCDLVGKEIFKDLVKYYDIYDALKIYCIALLRVCNPDIINDDIDAEYSTSYISEVYPNVSLSANTISSFLDKIGKRYNTTVEYMSETIAKYSGHTIVIDGMLKTNCSITNTYSEFSRKSRLKGTEDISLVYAFDLDTEEPVAFAAYPGNMLDSTSIRDFLQQFASLNGFIMMDKGFNDEEAKKIISEIGAKYLLPIKSSSRLIREHKLDRSFTNSFKYEDDCIRCKKIKLGDKFYYAFKSAEMQSAQLQGYQLKTMEKGRYDENKYEKKESGFGLIVFESNADLELKEVYKAYQERWEVEILFNNYKNIIDRQEVNVHGNYRMYATEFINYLSVVISSRIKKHIKKSRLNEIYSQKQIMRYLSKCLMRRNTKNPEKWIPCSRLKYVNEIMSSLGLS